METAHLVRGLAHPSIVHAFELDDRTIANWRDQAGAHSQHIHEALVKEGKLILGWYAPALCVVVEA